MSRRGPTSSADFEPLSFDEGEGPHAAEHADAALAEPTEPGALLYRADAERVFGLLASHQFEDSFFAFRELYANALDATGHAPDARIELSVTPARVVVADWGPGLSRDGIDALVTIGRSTRRGGDAIGRFGIGFVSIFDPALGVASVEVDARRADEPRGVRVVFEADARGAVRFEARDAPPPRRAGTVVTVTFDPERAPPERARRVREVLQTHAAYSGVQTWLDGRRLGRDLDDYLDAELESRALAPAELRVAQASKVRGDIGVAAVDSARSDASFRVYQRGLFVGEIPVTRPSGRPWIRGGFGAAYASDLTLVASRNDFVRDAKYARFLEELTRLLQEAAYRVVRYWQSTGDAHARTVLLDALRRGLKTASADAMLVEGDDLFSSAVVRAPLFRAWGERRTFSFEELAELARADRLRAQSFRPARGAALDVPILRADDSIERDIFRRLAGVREMPAVARAEPVAKPTLWSRACDRLMSGPRAEYSLFDRDLEQLTPDLRRLVEATERFLEQPAVAAALSRMLGSSVPRVGVGRTRNAFGPLAAYRGGEIRLNANHRIVKSLARHRDADLAVRALLPVIAHELAHVCHELHDLDFYRTSRALLRTLVMADI